MSVSAKALPGAAEFLERLVVAPVAHHIVIARAQQTAFVLRIVRKEAPALTYIEDVGEHVRQARERSITLLFDPERSLAQRILDEQFEL